MHDRICDELDFRERIVTQFLRNFVITNEKSFCMEELISSPKQSQCNSKQQQPSLARNLKAAAKSYFHDISSKKVGKLKK